MARIVIPGDDEYLGVTEWIGRAGYIPRGRLTMGSGRDGTGKTTLYFDIAARKTQGLPILEPGAGEPLHDVPPAARTTSTITHMAEGGRDILRRRQRAAIAEAERAALNAGGVLIVSNEESAEDDIIPRLDAMGADRQRYRVIDDQDADTDGPILLPRDLELIAGAAREVDAQLIILDTILSMLASRDYHQVRRDLHGLRQLARELNAAIVAINHLDKFGKMALGASGLLTIFRSRLICERDPEAREPYHFVLRPEKSSKGGSPVAIKYETVQDRETGIITVRMGDLAPNVGTDADLANQWRRDVEELILTLLAPGPMTFVDLCARGKEILPVTPDILRKASYRLRHSDLIRWWREVTPQQGGRPLVRYWWSRPEHYRQTPTADTRAN